MKLTKEQLELFRNYKGGNLQKMIILRHWLRQEAEAVKNTKTDSCNPPKKPA